MKARTIILWCSVLAILMLGGSAVAADNFLELTPGAEKWYKELDPLGPQFKQMHTLVSRYQGGLFNMRREFLVNNKIVRADDCLFDLTAQGDIYYLGSLQEGLYENPILWVDAPLNVGKVWKDSRLDMLGGTDQTVHYMFAVLKEEKITCPMGNYLCYQVFMTVIYPDGKVDNSAFWYNDHCGMIRCGLELCDIYELTKSHINPSLLPHGIQPHETNPDEYLVGSLWGAPNPANPMTTISFELKQPASVVVEVFDISGRLVKRLAQGEFMAAGPVSIRWQGDDEQGQAVASGTYLYRVKAGPSVSTNRITLVR